MKLTGIQYGIILSGLATAFLHLSFYPVLGLDPVVISGLGYISSLAAYFLPIPFLQQEHRMVRWGLVAYTLLTLVLWVILGDKNFVPGTPSAIGYYAMAAEVFLLIFLWLDKPEALTAVPGTPKLHHYLGFIAGFSFGLLFICSSIAILVLFLLFPGG